VDFSADLNGDFWAPRSGPSLVRALTGSPVGCYQRPDGALAHRPGGLIQHGDHHAVVGWITSARAHGDGVEVVIHLIPAARQIRQALLKLERDRRLSWMSLSIDALADAFDRLNSEQRVFYSAAYVRSLDFCGVPAGRACCVRRRLPCPSVV